MRRRPAAPPLLSFLAAANFALSIWSHCRGFPRCARRVAAIEADQPDFIERKSRQDLPLDGKYHDDVNERDTLDTQLNVFETFHSKLPESTRDAPYLFLGNIHPAR